ncbi:MmgE/PrpD family protein [uncultured Microbacterium sp.]|uniref:MmgE/PrpD family protein n=1 Tax=uncultured Microbacterium sp. TaxID=191216 RepID=UPI00262B915D|nr:MmgE/PrpD family protein [uncultured Microbacterium sp.]
MLSQSTRALAEFAATAMTSTAPKTVRESLHKTLVDSIGVGIAGQRTPEHQRLRNAWPASAGEARLWGDAEPMDASSAVMLNGVALCMLELDEGNKFARGHPGAHVLPAVIAEAERVDASGKGLLDAFLAGYEVAARLARAFTPTPGLHPHGHWGAVGAAAAVGRLNAFTTAQLAEAMDAAAGLALASPFSSAMRGTFVRNTWVGAAGVNGMTAARLAAAGLGSLHDTGAATFGALLGSVDDDELLRDLGARWEISGGYYKRHSSCNYTHPPADAALTLREDGRFDPDAVTAVTVQTHALAIPLSSTAPETRLAAMFSIPHVVATALVHGHVSPEAFTEASLDEAQVARIRDLTTVEFDREIDAARPAGRGARVIVALADGGTLTAEVPNAMGDADHHPFTRADIDAKLERLVGAGQLTRIHESVSALEAGASARDALGLLRSMT